MNSLSNNNNTRQNQKKSSKYDIQDLPPNKLRLIPIVFIVAILPFIMYLYEYNSGLAQFTWGFSTNDGTDIFLHYKLVFFIIASCTLVLITLYHLITKKVKITFSLPLIFILAYGTLAVISTVFSDYSHWGYTGSYDQFESVFALIGYCVVVFYIWLFVKAEKDIKYILKYLIISILLLSLLGLTQFLGHDFIATSIGKRLYLPPKYWDFLDAVEFHFEANRVYLTFFNPNYVGVYASMILPLLVGLLFTERVRKHIVLISISIVGMIICLLGSGSSTGIISFILSIILLIVFFRKYIFKNRKISLLIITTVVVVCVPLVTIKADTIKSTFTKILNMNKTDFAIKEIATGEKLSINYYNNIMNIDFDLVDSNIALEITDESGNTLSIQPNQEKTGYIIADERFNGIIINPIMHNDILCVQVTIGDKDWIFSNQTGDGTFYYLNRYNKFDKIVAADSSLFTGYERYASSRGYIWSRSIPLLKNYLLLGAGADAYTFVFPQQDYVGFYNAELEGGLLTKPHSMYLQIGIQTGVLSLFCILIFYGIYFVQCIRRYFNGNFDTFYKRVGVSIFLGTVGYMISGLSNDSSITIAPVFWVLLGLGYTINHLVKNESKNDEEVI